MARFQGFGETSPRQAFLIFASEYHCLQSFVLDLMRIDITRSFCMQRMEDFMVGSRVFVVKERDEWSNFAEFVGAMVAKYADKMDFESLPDPDLYLLKRDMLDWYKAYNRARQKKVYFDVEYVKHA